MYQHDPLERGDPKYEHLLYVKKQDFTCFKIFSAISRSQGANSATVKGKSFTININSTIKLCTIYGTIVTPTIAL